MTDELRTRGRFTGPSGVIAISLFIIAVCLVILVIRRQSEKRPAEPTVATDTAQAPSRPPNRFFTKRSGNKTNSSSAPLAGSSNQSDHAIVTFSETTVARSAMAGGIPGGIIALGNRTNFSTGIAGHVTLRGQPPPESPIDITAESECASLQTNNPTTRRFIVSPDAGLANVLIVIGPDLKKGDSYTNTLPSSTHTLRFVNCAIEPYVSAAAISQDIVFADFDSLPHKVHITSTNNPNFNSRPLSLKQREQLTLKATKPGNWSKPELFMQVTCELHSWESAYLSLVGNPHFAITDTNGDFTIPNVRPGRYKIRALHQVAQSTNTTMREVSVVAGKISTVNFTLDVPDQSSSFEQLPFASRDAR